MLSIGCSNDALNANGAQSEGYEKLWQEVQAFTDKGLPKSALPLVEKIYQEAKARGHAAEFIKALIHKLRFIQAVEEEPFIKLYTMLTAELKTSQFPVTPVLHSMLAEQLWHYYQQNRYRFIQRTALAAGSVKDDDMRTWDLRQIVQEVVRHYQESLKDSKKSKHTKIDIYDKILYTGSTGRKYRPTLYDFLAQRAVDFYMDSESGLTQPVYRFTLNNEDYFAEARQFAKLDISSQDPLSFHYFALTILQDLIRFHQEDKEADALVDVDLKRLRFVYREAVIDNKEVIYEKVLKHMIHAYGEVPVAGEIYYELAVFYNQLGDKFQPMDAEGKAGEKYKWYRKKAHDLCREAVKKYPGSAGARNCTHLINQIEGGRLDVILEEAVTPNKPFPALIKYRNINNLYLRVVKTSREEIEEKTQLAHDKMVAYFIARPAIKSWQSGLPDDGDFQSHGAEIKVDGLEPGEYLLLCANSTEFDFKNHAVVYTFFEVTNIAYVYRNRDKQGLEFHLMNRETGKPLADASAQTWYRQYNRVTRTYEYKKGPQYRTDARGYFHIPWQSSARNYFRLEFFHGQDRLYARREFYLYNPYNRYGKGTRTFFFTDRSIYRPGQTLYFKGIVLHVDSKDGEKNRILPGYSTRVLLYDVNHQKVGQLNLVTNEYGTFSGSFQLPLGRLNGNWSISDGFGSSSFSVEEYKRPKFYVTFEPLKETYKLNDRVTVRGKAQAYAGYPIDNAEVRFNVVREVFYPFHWYYWGYMPPSPKMEILNGGGKTDDRGEFEIRFEAVPDLTLDKETRPAFNFVVSAEVTDINGETRQALKKITIGYTALKIGMNVPEELDKDKGQYTFALQSTSLSGDFVPAAGKIAFYRLKEPERLFRQKLWPNPDRFTMNKDDYYKHFSHDSYADEDNFRRWHKGRPVFSGTFDTGKSKEFKLIDIDRWQTGKYVMEMESMDRHDNPVKEVRYFTLYSAKEKRVPYNMLDWFTVPKATAEPGERALVLIGSSAKDVRVIYELEYRGDILQKSYIHLSKEQKRLEIPIEEKHRGNLGIHLTFIKHNRVFRHSQNITVPWSNKELEVTFETFRDKLQPAEKEEWRIKIRGKKGANGEPGEKAAAEMLAALYDASLDAFRPHSWNFHIYPHHYTQHQWQDSDYFGTVHSQRIGVLQKISSYVETYYDTLNWFGFYLGYFYGQGMVETKALARPAPLPPGRVRETLSEAESAEVKKEKGRKRNGDKDKAEGGVAAEEPAEKEAVAEEVELSAVKARTQFQETAFFYPHLRTDENGEIIIAFTIPEALTRWKMLGFAHTRNLEYGLVTNQLVTQKELMVVPNVPRFFREGDTLVLSTKITNLSEKELSGTARLMLFDAVTMQPVDARFKNNTPDKDFKTARGQSGQVGWTIQIPEDLDAVTYRILAKAGKFSDGEEQAVPILKNRMLVTETLPLPVRARQSKDFEFKKLTAAGKSTTLKHHRLTLEFTANPVWYAVQALPYLMEYPYECLEQVFSRYYANSLAAFIVNADPKIKKVFDLWQAAEGGSALLSNLEKNQELKTLLLEETPWVMDARNETERKRCIALLFDLNHMAAQSQRALQKLKEGQLPSGAWAWFHGMVESRYITQHIVCGFAHLHRLQVIDARKNEKIWAMLKDAVPYLDRKIREDYDWLLRQKLDLKSMHIGYIHIHYLYARSYFQDIPMDDSVQKAFEYYQAQAKKYWLHFNNYLKGMIALSLNRYQAHQTAQAIARSIKEHALYSEEMGMYWKDSYGYYWYQAAIETQALLIEMFAEVLDDQESVDEMRTWLLKQKQTQDWRTTKATAEACYALLLRGTQWLAESKPPEITLGKIKKIKIEPDKLEDVRIEAGTGYFKTAWTGSDITPDMGHITVKNNNQLTAWGGLYWQYFENLDKITPAETPLQLKKQLFIEKSSDTGPVLVPLKNNKLKIGDKIKVRIELRLDRTMEYVHMKDMRASGFEPENVISRCKWQDGLCYYESTRDASTNFFFDHLPEGTYVFEYPLRVSHTGDFSNGITSIQCMYAPEFTSHSAGIRVKID